MVVMLRAPVWQPARKNLTACHSTNTGIDKYSSDTHTIAGSPESPLCLHSQRYRLSPGVAFLVAVFGMKTNEQTEPQLKTFRAYIFNKISYAAIVLIVGAVGGLAYFRLSPPRSNPLPVAVQPPQQQKLPEGAILIPDARGVCHLHALDNATGQIDDYGVVDCSSAADQNLSAWRRAMNKDVGTEVSKSFRHESDERKGVTSR